MVNCKEKGDTCACCALDHRMNTCSSTNLSLKCTNCPSKTAKGHGSANRDCPAFITETRKPLQCNPENKYKYYPTDNPTTWTLLSNHNNDYQDNTWYSQHYNKQTNTNTYQPLRDTYCPSANNDYHSDTNPQTWKGDYYCLPPMEDWQLVNRQ